jgi:opacity protein-like surface antigen
MAMRVAIFLLGGFLLFSVPAKAQWLAGSTGPQSGPGHISANQPERDGWQFGFGYQYNRDNLVGTPFNTHGINLSVTHYFNNWFGVEGQLGAGLTGSTGMTTTPPNSDVKSLFIGGGARVAYHNRTRFEPWVHVLLGLDHYRFVENAGFLGSNNALAYPLGGGVDTYLTAHLAIRAEADYVMSRFFSSSQRSFQAIGGLVLGF